MFQIDRFVCATDLHEAYGVLQKDPKATVLGGCGYLRLGRRTIPTAIDLSHLGLDFIEEKETSIEIGAMTSLRRLETNTLLKDHFGTLFVDTVKGIVGVQFRNCVTLGGSVAGRYPFSDPITALMALEAELEFFNHGRVSLAVYLNSKGFRDILVKIILPKDGRKTSFASLRKTSTDYSVLNVAVSRKVDDSFKIVVGSRPGRAIYDPVTEKFLQSEGLTEQTIKKAGTLVAENLQFGDNPRASREYREAICPVLVRRALEGVGNAP